MNTKLTKKGLELIQSITNGEGSLVFTKATFSDKEHLEGEEFEELESIKQEANFSEIQKEQDDIVRLTTTITNTNITETYQIKTIGIYAKITESEEVLYAYINVLGIIYIDEFKNLTKNTFNFYVKTSDAENFNVNFYDENYSIKVLTKNEEVDRKKGEFYFVINEDFVDSVNNVKIQDNLYNLYHPETNTDMVMDKDGNKLSALLESAKQEIKYINIPNGTDFNTLKTNGYYRVQRNDSTPTMINFCPSNRAGVLKVTSINENGYCRQDYTVFTLENMDYTRVMINDVWSEWKVSEKQHLIINSYSDTLETDPITTTSTGDIVASYQNNNQMLSFGVNKGFNDRSAWIQCRHTQIDGFGAAVGSIDLNPLGGDVKVNSRIVFNHGNFNTNQKSIKNEVLTSERSLSLENMVLSNNQGYPLKFGTTNHMSPGISFEDIRDFSEMKPNDFNMGQHYSIMRNSSSNYEETHLYHGLLTFKYWHDISGGSHNVVQIGHGHNIMKFRCSTGLETWGEWQSILTDTTLSLQKEIDEELLLLEKEYLING